MDTIIGIDFGTTNSVVALYGRGMPRVLRGDHGEAIVPSAVYIDEDRRVHVGYPARNVALLYPERTITSVKRLIGRGTNIVVGDREYSAEQIASYLFRSLRERAEAKTGTAISKAVVSVPAYYDDRRRRAIEKAANLAELEVVRLLNEPTAAALAHRIEGQRTIVVYDLGGGTFDVSVLEAGDGVFRVLASRGDAHLGGDDFDQEIVRFLLNEIREDSGLNLEEDRLARHKLRIAAERAKIELSTRDEASIEIPLIGSNIFGACNLDTIITRDDLERMIRGFVRQTIRLTRGALGDASVRPEDVDHVLLVGGSTRMPIVRAAVMELIGREPEADLDPDLAVARGAAMEAAVLSGAASETVLVDVTPLGLGVQTASEGLVTLLPRNTVLPARARAVFTTVSDNQRRARVTVLQGERPRAEDNVLIGSFDLDGIEPARCGKPDIEVQFDVDVDGILQVRATDLTTTSSEMVTLEAPMSIDDDAVTEAVEQAREAELERALPGYGGARS